MYETRLNEENNVSFCSQGHVLEDTNEVENRFIRGHVNIYGKSAQLMEYREEDDTKVSMSPGVLIILYICLFNHL